MTEQFILKVVGVIGVTVLSVVLAISEDNIAMINPKVFAIFLELMALVIIFCIFLKKRGRSMRPLSHYISILG